MSGIFFFSAPNLFAQTLRAVTELPSTMTRKTATAIALATTLLIGCGPPAKTQPSNINLAGFPAAFKEGYSDGCQSVGGQTSVRRDDKRFASDRQYASGWRDGFDACSRAKGQNN